MHTLSPNDINFFDKIIMSASCNFTLLSKESKFFDLIVSGIKKLFETITIFFSNSYLVKSKLSLLVKILL